MTPVTPKELHEGAKLVIHAEHQPEYNPLPTSQGDDGVVMTEWQPSEDERKILAEGGRVRLWISTFNQKLQPVVLEAVTAPSGPSPLVN